VGEGGKEGGRRQRHENLSILGLFFFGISFTFCSASRRFAASKAASRGVATAASCGEPPKRCPPPCSDRYGDEALLLGRWWWKPAALESCGEDALEGWEDDALDTREEVEELNFRFRGDADELNSEGNGWWAERVPHESPAPMLLLPPSKSPRPPTLERRMRVCTRSRPLSVSQKLSARSPKPPCFLTSFCALSLSTRPCFASVLIPSQAPMAPLAPSMSELQCCCASGMILLFWCLCWPCFSKACSALRMASAPLLGVGKYPSGARLDCAFLSRCAVGGGHRTGTIPAITSAKYF
jgi:hypothetical protein